MKEELILRVFETNPYLSNREIGKIVGISRSTVQYYLNKLGIHRDRKLMQRLNNTNREKRIKITYNAEQILLGSVLGDGYLSPNRHPENTKLILNSELRIAHGESQKEYIEYKKELLEREGIRCSLTIFPSSNRVHYIKGIPVIDGPSYRLKTQRNVAFNFYRDLFYKPHKKLNRYFYKLNALGLAIWFMDDGYKHGNGYVLCTNCFTLKEVSLLRDILKHNFNLDTTCFKSNLGAPLIYIKASSKNSFLELVSSYICESMKYKLGV